MALTYTQLWHSLTPLYSEGEAQAIVRMVLENEYGWSLTDIVCGKVSDLSLDEQHRLQKIADRLQRGEPVQYVLGQAIFCGRSFHVAPGVLIPRPETESLCRLIMNDFSVQATQNGCRQHQLLHLLDIGTGSGCIAITLSLDMPCVQVEAWDVSAEALHIAAYNARQLQAQVCLAQHDILCPITAEVCPPGSLDIIVSNPPYICRQEANAMASNVLEHEPHLALFVPNDDPLRFYRAIALMGVRALCSGGLLYFELNPLYADKVVAMLQGEDYVSPQLIADDYGKQRFVKCVRP